MNLHVPIPSIYLAFNTDTCDQLTQGYYNIFIFPKELL